MSDVGNWPFKQARDYYKGRSKPVRLVVVHATATGEGSRVAETIQQTWTTDDGRPASAHVICDNDSTVRSVHDADTAWAAKSANADGLHVEIVGQATQTAAQWADPYSKAALARAVKVVGAWCFHYNIPVRRLSKAQLQDGKSRGICGHNDVSAAFPSTGHSDPGPNFPWTYFLQQVQGEVTRLGNKPPTRKNPWPAPILGRRHHLGQGGRNDNPDEWRHVQWALGVRETGQPDHPTLHAVEEARRHYRITEGNPTDVTQKLLDHLALVRH